MRRLFVNFRATLCVVLLLVLAVPSFAQNSKSGSKVTVVLQDATNDEAVGFATVSLTKKGAQNPSKYALTDSNGKGVLEGVADGTYTLKAEMMGYIAHTQEITISKDVNIGTIKLKQDQEVLDAASVSAVGNPIIVKKDTIEYNASSFKITENDVLEDLLKKFPGIEVGSDGSITANGQTITKIYVDGKTYFLNDPTLATKNLPAKIIEKVKVIQKKSDQAEFTGIDDGQEETVLDLSVQRGMMNGLMGNLRGGIGHDFPVDDAGYDDHRFNANLFMGNFSNGAQYSIIGNANNGGNMGFGGFGGQMMRGMMGGGMGSGMGGGNGVTTSYMLGASLGYDLFDNKMTASGDYNLNGAKNDNRSESYQERYYNNDKNPLASFNQYSNSSSISTSNSMSHNIGLRIDHKFSSSSSIIFQPSISFGTGRSNSLTETSIDRADFSDRIDEEDIKQYSYKLSDGFNSNSSSQKQVSASGMLQYRQRLGIPGRTLVVNGNFSLSNTISDGYTQSLTNRFTKDNQTTGVQEIINQRTENNNKSTNLTMRATYTEPLGNRFYVEGNYAFNYSNSNQDKKAFDATPIDGFSKDDHTYKPLNEVLNPVNSNTIRNINLRHTIGANMLYQSDDLTMQVGLSLIPTTIHNETQSSNRQIDTTYTVINWSPQAMIRWRASDFMNYRLTYRGNSSQPSVSQLVPVFDNTNPNVQSLGNPYLIPSFSHSIDGEIRWSNPRTFSSLNARIGGGFNQNPTVNAQWDNNGKMFTMPVNGPTSTNANINLFGNFPIARSNFSVSTNAGARASTSASFIGNDVNMEGILTPTSIDY
ncbi:MAG: TonB-dependent receptor, partial [Bacteroidales bacterium]|nr:TonB-dependent receptor [Bacteroidales bacterium]